MRLSIGIDDLEVEAQDVVRWEHGNGGGNNEGA